MSYLVVAALCVLGWLVVFGALALTAEDGHTV